jgi:hypothetical protein
MPYRFTDTAKWEDKWFSGLKPVEKLLFLYLCDNCDPAGFIEINIRRWAFDLQASEHIVEGALKGVEKSFIYSTCKNYIYIRNFLRHQKNYPLNENNRAHRGVISRFAIYSQRFDIQDISSFIERGFKGALQPQGRGTGIGIGNNNNNNYKNKDKHHMQREFYNTQLEISGNDSNYEYLINFIFENKSLGRPLDALLKVRDQITYKQFTDLFMKSKNLGVKLTDVLLDFENSGDTKKYKILSRTISNWIDNRANGFQKRK